MADSHETCFPRPQSVADKAYSCSHSWSGWSLSLSDTLRVPVMSQVQLCTCLCLCFEAFGALKSDPPNPVYFPVSLPIPFFLDHQISLQQRGNGMNFKKQGAELIPCMPLASTSPGVVLRTGAWFSVGLHPHLSLRC